MRVCDWCSVLTRVSETRFRSVGLRTLYSVVKPNMNVHDIGTFVSDVVDEYGFFVDRNYCGHGIGKLFHCNPTIPHTRSRHGGWS